MNDLSKNDIDGILQAPISCWLVGNLYRRAKVTLERSDYVLTLTVTVTHPLLKWVSGSQNSVFLICWGKTSGTEVKNFPDELYPLVDKMKEMCKMSDEEASYLDAYNKSLEEKYNGTYF